MSSINDNIEKFKKEFESKTFEEQEIYLDAIRSKFVEIEKNYNIEVTNV